MQKNVFHYLVISLMFVTFCSLAGIGLLLGYVIPGGGKTFFFLERYEWGQIHLTLALVMLALVAAHLVMNRAWILHSTKRFMGDDWKPWLAGLSVAWIAVILIGWLAQLI